MSLHRRIGDRLEEAYREHAPEIPAELELHLDQARDIKRGIVYLKHAAETDRRRSANQEAKMHLHRALELLKLLAASPERNELEVNVRLRPELQRESAVLARRTELAVQKNAAAIALARRQICLHSGPPSPWADIGRRTASRTARGNSSPHIVRLFRMFSDWLILLTRMRYCPSSVTSFAGGRRAAVVEEAGIRLRVQGSSFCSVSRLAHTGTGGVTDAPDQLLYSL